MLEEVLRENTSAIRELSAAIRAIQAKPPKSDELYAQQKAIHDEPPLTGDETQAAAAAIVGTAKGTNAADAATKTPGEHLTNISYEQVVARVQRLVAAGKRDLIVDALQAFGCANAKHLRPEQFGEFLQALTIADD
jgi:hypothetical protein